MSSSSFTQRIQTIQMRTIKVRLYEKDEEIVTLDDPITNETKEVPVVTIDWLMILKAIKKSKNGYTQI